MFKGRPLLIALFNILVFAGVFALFPDFFGTGESMPKKILLGVATGIVFSIIWHVGFGEDKPPKTKDRQ